jgi:hypothetical protein
MAMGTLLSPERTTRRVWGSFGARHDLEDIPAKIVEFRFGVWCFLVGCGLVVGWELHSGCEHLVFLWLSV